LTYPFLTVLDALYNEDNMFKHKVFKDVIGPVSIKEKNNGPIYLFYGPAGRKRRKDMVVSAQSARPVLFQNTAQNNSNSPTLTTDKLTHNRDLM